MLRDLIRFIDLRLDFLSQLVNHRLLILLTLKFLLFIEESVLLLINLALVFFILFFHRDSRQLKLLFLSLEFFILL